MNMNVKNLHLKTALPLIPFVLLIAIILGYMNLTDDYSKVAQNLIECRAALVKVPTQADSEKAIRKKCSEQVLVDSMGDKPKKLDDAIKAMNFAYGTCLTQNGMAPEKLQVD